MTASALHLLPLPHALPPLLSTEGVWGGGEVQVVECLKERSGVLDLLCHFSLGEDPPRQV